MLVSATDHDRVVATAISGPLSALDDVHQTELATVAGKRHGVRRHPPSGRGAVVGKERPCRFSVLVQGHYSIASPPVSRRPSVKTRLRPAGNPRKAWWCRDHASRARAQRDEQRCTPCARAGLDLATRAPTPPRRYPRLMSKAVTVVETRRGSLLTPVPGRAAWCHADPLPGLGRAHAGPARPGCRAFTRARSTLAA